MNSGERAAVRTPGARIAGVQSRWRPVVLAAVIDLVLVGVFVAIGRASHREDQSAFLVTLWPFAAGLAAGWLVARVRRRPLALLHGGVPAWLGTVVVGVLLRAVSEQGVQPAFVVVALVVNGGLLVGWRLLLAALDRAATRSEAITPIDRLRGRR